MKQDVLRVFRVVAFIMVFFATSCVNQSQVGTSQKEALIDADVDKNVSH